METIPPGYYDDSNGNQRWWDGAKWTDTIKSDQSSVSKPSKSIEERAGELLQEIWGEGIPTSTSKDVAVFEEPAKITFFNGKRQALELQAKLEASNHRITELNSSIKLKQNEISELKTSIVKVDGLSLADTTRLIKTTRLAYDEATKELNDELAIMRADLERERNHTLESIRTEYASAKASYDELVRQRNRLDVEVINLNITATLQEVGYYDFDHPAQSSVQLSADLAHIRGQIKDILKLKQATTASAGFTFNNSAAQGRKFVSDMSNLLLRSYNAEAENCIKTVKAGNLAPAVARLEKAKDQAEKLGKMVELRISNQFHKLRIQEMELANTHLQAVAVEKELERERRDELREAKRVEDELARQKKALEDSLKREREKYQRSIVALRERGDFEAIARMDAEIIEIEKGIADVDYRAANIKAGYVYIISNIGAFGAGVVKIGLTRRLDPLDRVKELSGASVPFRFDVHAIIFSADAPALEASLHRHFASVKVNKANPRKEFFRTTPQDVLNVLRNANVEVLEYVLEPEAEEWKATLALDSSNV